MQTGKSTTMSDRLEKIGLLLRAAAKTVGLKKCSSCKKKKPAEAFYARKNRRGGRTSHCVSCQAKKFRRYRKENMPYMAQRLRDWVSENREQARGVLSCGTTIYRDGQQLDDARKFPIFAKVGPAPS